MFLLSPIFFFSDLIIQGAFMSVVDQGCSGFWTLRLAQSAKFQKTKSTRDSLCVSFTADSTYTNSFLWAVSKMATFLNISELLTWRSSWYIHHFQYVVEILFSSLCMSIVKSKYVTLNSIFNPPLYVRGNFQSKSTPSLSQKTPFTLGSKWKSNPQSLSTRQNLKLFQ